MGPTSRPPRTLALALAAAFVASAALASPASADRIYGGQKVSERLQVVLSVTDDGSALTSIALVSEMNCRTYFRTDTGTTTSVATLPAEPEEGVLYLADTAIAGGRVNASLLIVRDRGTSRSDIGRARLSGELTAGGGSGTFTITSQIVEKASGRTVRTCTRSMPWRVARDPGRLFAGNTSQGAPVVLRLSADRRRVTTSLIGWVAPCRLSGYYFEPHDDWLLPFAVAGDGAFTERYRYDAGERRDVIARFAGRFAGDRASGTLRSRVVGGGERCTIGRRTWTAATG